MLSIESERLILRELMLTDAPFIFELLNEPDWITFIGNRNIAELKDAQNYILNGPMDSYHKHGYGLWCIQEKKTMNPVGLCGLLQRDFLDAPDLGYAILSRFHGIGYATEAAQASLQYANKSLNIKNILAFTTPDNQRSIAVLEKVGMAFKDHIITEGEAGHKLLYEIRLSPE